MKQAAGTAWESKVSALRLFHYITFRSAGAAVTALLLSLWFGPKVIAWLKELSFGQNYRDRAEVAGNLTGREPGKMGTPTMGGLLIVLTLNLTTLLWAQWNTLVQLTVLSVVVLAGLGFYDDYTKIIKASGGGAKSRVKLWVQTALALFIGIYLWWVPATRHLVTEIMVPFYKHPVVNGMRRRARSFAHGFDHRREFQCGESDGWIGWPGDWLHPDCLLCLPDSHLFGGQFEDATGYLQIPHVSGAA